MRKFLCILCVFLPVRIKIFIYRNIFGWKIDYSVKIGFSFIFSPSVEIGKNTVIRHFNIFSGMSKLKIGSNVKIGIFNYFGSGELVHLDDEVEINRFNEINAIHNALCFNEFDSSLIVGRSAVITAHHKIDFTDRVEIGAGSIIAGRNSCIWTHNRQSTKPVRIGAKNYIGSGCQFVAGSSFPSYSILALGSVVTKPILGDYGVYGGVPAKYIKPIDDSNRLLVEFDTRPDLRKSI